MTLKETMNAIRKAIGEYEGPEIVLLEELEAEAEGWKMRIQELEEEDKE